MTGNVNDYEILLMLDPELPEERQGDPVGPGRVEGGQPWRGPMPVDPH